MYLCCLSLSCLPLDPVLVDARVAGDNGRDGVKEDGEENGEVEDEDGVCDGARVEQNELGVKLEQKHVAKR